MKKIKLLMLLIVMLSNSLRCWSTKNDTIPSTGELLQDSTTVMVNIDDIRKANVKMIERNYYIAINKEQKEIIKFKDNFINEQQNIIAEFQKKLYDSKNINNKLTKDIEKERKRNKNIIITSVGIISALVIGVIIK